MMQQKPVTTEEIRNAMFSMKKCTTSGPDGFTVDFFLLNWQEVGNEVVQAVQYCFNQQYMYKPLIPLYLLLYQRYQLQIQ